MMRITNSIITANTKANLNTNKVYADKLNTMTASGQKITRPSDDPVVAIRAMRLNTSLTELEQYHGKNIPDASAWFTDTETALSQTDAVLSDIREKLNQASSQENVSDNVKDILEELKQLKVQFYTIGNADSAGRTVFTGYRTGEMLTFMEDDKLLYNIDEKFKKEDLETFDYIKGTTTVDMHGKALEPDGTGAEKSDYTETDVTSVKSYRLRLSYGNITDDIAEATAAGKDPRTAVSYVDSDGNKQAVDFEVVSITGKSSEEIDAIYAKPDTSYLIKETGELVLKKEDYDNLIKAKDITVSYQKEQWQKGDPRPEHYFKCDTPVDLNDPRTYSATYPNGIEYNYNRVDEHGNPTTKSATELDPSETDPNANVTGFKEQDLTYEISFNQSIQINTHANDVYSHDIGRDIDELITITEKVAASETKIKYVQDAIASETDPAKLEELNRNLAAVKKENTLYKERMHEMYTAAITSFKEYSDDINKQISNVGALTARLEMTKNRVRDQKDNVKILADENINADLSETALDFKNAQLALEAAQMAAGKITKQTLLNYI